MDHIDAFGLAAPDGRVTAPRVRRATRGWREVRADTDAAVALDVSVVTDSDQGCPTHTLGELEPRGCWLLLGVSLYCTGPTMQPVVARLSQESVMWSILERRDAGSSAVEFVFVVPLLVVLVFGIIQFGIAYNRSQGMHAAVREGARLASIGAAVSEVEDRLEDALGGTTVDPSDVTSGGVEVRRYADGDDPTDQSLGTLLTGADVPCDGSAAAHAVRVDVEVVGNLSRYAITIPFLPSWSQTYPSEAIFRCEG